MPSARPAIGVVMPAHNASRFIDQALASIAAQGLLPEQVVVVDDASADDTADRAEAWTGRLPMKVIRLATNVGSGTARRLAVEHTSTELVAPLDADDVWLPDHLEHLAAVQARNGGVVSGRAWVWRPGQARLDYHRALGLRVPADGQLEALLSENFVFFGSLFPRDDYDRAEGFGKLRGWEDWELWIRMAANGVRFSLAEVPTVLYRRHEGNLTGDTEAFDSALLARIEQLRHEHPDWVSPAAWDRVVTYRRAQLQVNRGVARLRRRQPAGAIDLLRGTAGSAPTARKLAVTAGRRATDRLRGRSVTRFR